MENILKLKREIQKFLNLTQIEFEQDSHDLIFISENDCGKNPIIESFVELDVLPKSTEKISKPIIIKLIYSPGESDYYKLSFKRDVYFRNKTELQNEICQQMKKILYNSSKFQQILYFVEIYSSRFIENMNIINLPEIANSFPASPQDNRMNTENIYEKYLSKKTGIIVALVSATMDINTSKTIHMAQKFDPDLKRTIGVLTNVDLVGSGINISKTLLNKNLYLKLKWFALISYVSENPPAREKKFFWNHPLYKKFINQCGVDNLFKYISEICVQQTKNKIKNIENQINLRIKECEDEISKISYIRSDLNEFQKVHFLTKQISEFQYQFMKLMGASNDHTDLGKICPGYYIRKLMIENFNENYRKEVMINIDEKLDFAVENASGILGYVEIPDSVIRSVIRDFILPMKRCSNNAIIKIGLEIKNILCTIKIDPNFKHLNDQIIEFCSRVISIGENKLCETMNFFIDSQINHICFQHPDFLGFKRFKNKEEFFYESSVSSFDCGQEKFSAEFDSNYFEQNSTSVLVIIENGFIFILSSDEKNNLILNFPLRNCEFSSKRKIKNGFTIIHSTNRFLANNIKHVDLRFQSEKICNEVYSLVNKAKKTESSSSQSQSKEEVFTNIMKLKYMALKYIEIVRKTIEDLIVKFSHLLLISRIENYLTREISHHLLSKYHVNELMKYDDSEEKKLQELNQRKADLIEFLQFLKQNL